MAAVTAAQLGAFLNRPINTAQAEVAIGIVTSLAESYCRGLGFTDYIPNDEIAAVVMGASARVISNPRGIEITEVVGPQSAAFRGAFSTVAATDESHRYRIRDDGRIPNPLRLSISRPAWWLLHFDPGKPGSWLVGIVVFQSDNTMPQT